MPKDTESAITKIGKYAVIDIIGAGGMGIVYRARDAALNRTVAIKMLRRSAAPADQISQVEKFFKRELLATASLQHRNIVTVYEAGEEQGDPYLVMECLEGEPVSRIVSERRPMPLTEKLDILIQVCDGLQYAHDRTPQVIHRDIKPANVILLKDGTVKLVDFGIARIAGSETSVTKTGQLVGSLSYMSPEQINSLPLDSRTDIFSAGVLAYELLAYTLPFKGADPGSTFVKILREDPEPLRNHVPDLPPELEAAINHALAKKPQDRYQTAEEFGFELLSVQRKLKQGMTAEFLARAEAAVQRGDLERAKQQLLEITRLDRHHERANRLLAEVRKAIQGRERAAQVVQMRSQAQLALAGQQFDEAVACIEQALQLAPQDPQSLALREEIQNLASVHKSVQDLLSRAESAMLAGDLDEASVSVQKALALKPDSTEARALATMVEKEFTERSRRAQVQHLVDSAREEIANRQFEGAIESLRKAEELDPSDSNVRELLRWANHGKEQEHRRKELVDLTEEIDRALRSEDFSSAFTICELGLARYPNEQTLLRLRAMAERQKGVAERRQFVQEQSLAARELLEAGEFDKAIRLLEAGLAKIPAEPNFEALIAHTRKARQDQEASSRTLESEHASAEKHEFHSRRAAEEGANLQKALDDREQIDLLKMLAANLSSMLNSMEFDEQARRVCEPLIEQVEQRAKAKEQLLAELAELSRELATSSDAKLRSKAAGRVVEAKAAFPRERDVRKACDEILKAVETAKETRTRVTAELSRLAEEVSRVRMESAQGLLARAVELAAPFEDEPQIEALLQQIRFEVDRRQKRLEARIREIANLQGAISEAPSLDSISQLLQNAISISSPDAEESTVAAAVESVRKAGDARRRNISEALGQVEEITNRALAARSVEDAEKLLEEARTAAQAHPNIDEIQRNLVRVSAQVRGRRVEHDLLRGELETLTKSAQDNVSTSELEAIRRRVSEVQDRYPQERTLIALCKGAEAAVDEAREKFLRTELARVREEGEHWSSLTNVEPQALASSLRKLEDLVHAYPDNVELRSLLLKAQEALGRADRAQRDTLTRQAQTGSIAAPVAIEPQPAKSRAPLIGAGIAATLAVGGVIGWFTLHGSSAKSFNLVVAANPSSARIDVNGQTCTSPPCKFTLPANASFEASARLDGYATGHHSGIITGNESITLVLSKQSATQNLLPSVHPGHLVVSGLQAGDRLFIDGALKLHPDAAGGYTVAQGSHQLKIVDGNQELFADSKDVKPDATVAMSRSDFRSLAPVKSNDEQLAWDRAEQSQNTASFEDFLRKYPASPRRHEAETELENLYWTKATSAGTAAAYRDFVARYPSPQDLHYRVANDQIDQLDWKALQNSSDTAQISSFLARHPKGPYHDLAAGRLDELSWNAAKSAGTVDALRNYLNRYPGAIHKDEANSLIAELTPKPQPKPPAAVESVPAPQPRPTITSPQPENDRDAIRRTLDDYQDAYQSRDIGKLRAVFPNLDSSNANALSQLFKEYSEIRLLFSPGVPQISGDTATVTTAQQFEVKGKKGQHKTNSNVTIQLQKRDGRWYITSVR